MDLFSHSPPEDDIKLNSTLFYWPQNVVDVLDVANSRLNGLRESSEEALRARVIALEKSITSSSGSIEQMQKREVLSNDEINRANVMLDAFDAMLQGFTDEADAIIREEQLLQFEESSFPEIQEMKKAMLPYSRLWRTARDFDAKSKEWLRSPYDKVDAMEVDSIITDMYKLIHKLTKTLIDQPGSLKVAQKLRVSPMCRCDRYLNQYLLRVNV
ncbi:unnamed protein product [Dibothriocephalus latus]|uniref:Uncharacterized protein n=1 Tax=Dibothriocephalus latus TaxID=60516 RepID=A0A3P7M2S3_DIBLA|nr:unnamed protein product [Dibothriocephalus latus]